jgi:hypothetical protein
MYTQALVIFDFLVARVRAGKWREIYFPSQARD